MSDHSDNRSWKEKLYEIIFEADTPAGKLFDEVLIVSIIVSVLAVMLDSVASIRERYGNILYAMEWVFTILFSIEYTMRLISARKPVKYAVSFFGVVDLLTVIPTYLDILLPGTRFLLVIRILRVLRIFRVLKLAKYVGEANVLARAIKSSSRKIIVFLFSIITIVVILGSMMYLIEGGENGFTSIPVSIYWAIVTLTTVGYGDISPQTPIGQTLAVVVMILGYSIIAVPTGIVSAELAHEHRKAVTTQVCPDCTREGHDPDAKHCKFCGSEL